MGIKTKYNIGDEVWFIHGDCCISGTICGVEKTYGKGKCYGKPRTGEEKILVCYCIETNKYPFALSGIKEERLFPTKEELLKSL